MAIMILGLMTASQSAVADAAKTCQCRAGGEYYNTGSLICLGKGKNAQMARCEMALNNTSWKLLGERCPYAASTPPEPVLPMTPWRRVSAVAE